MKPILSEDCIMSDLITLAEQDAATDLLQFRSLVGAHQYLCLYQLCAKYLAEGSQVLDWGCGNGHFAYFLIYQGHRCSGFSFADFSLRQTLVDQGLQFRQGSSEEPVKLPYPDGQFDAVVSVGVLEHVRESQGDEAASMEEIYRILKPQGHFICYHFPNQHSWIELISARIPNKHHHLYRYTQNDIETLCQKANLKLLEVNRYGLLPRNLFGRLPNALAQNRWMALIWDACDGALGQLFSGICQNYYFVAQKESVG